MPPVLVTLDGLSHVMRMSEYRSASYDLIHAHDLSIVNWFMQHLSGAQPLPNGGLILAAMSYSQRLPTRTLDERLSQLEAEQALRTGTLPHDPAKDRMAAFLEATEQQSSPIPAMDPLVRYDDRVLDILGRGAGLTPSTQALPLPLSSSANAKAPKDQKTAGEATSVPPAATATPPRVLRCAGLDRDAARALMEYWARSGMLRAQVTPPLVDRQWALAGGGVVGELERGCLKAGLMAL